MDRLTENLRTEWSTGMLTKENLEALIPQLGKIRDIQLAKEYGVSRERIRQLRMKRGIPKVEPKVRKPKVVKLKKERKPRKKAAPRKTYSVYNATKLEVLEWVDDEDVKYVVDLMAEMGYKPDQITHLICVCFIIKGNAWYRKVGEETVKGLIKVLKK